MGATGSHTGAASRNVAVDGARFSSHSIIGAACEPGSRSADRCYRPTRITDLGMRVDSPGSWKALHGSTCLANRAALAHFPRGSHRIPGPPFWLILLFFGTAILLAAEMRLKHPLRKTMVWGLC